MNQPQMKKPPTPEEQAQLVRRSEYLSRLRKAMESDPESLSKHERRLMLKHEKYVVEAKETLTKMERIRQQIEQMDATLRSLVLQHSGATKKAEAFLESLDALEFDDEPEVKPTEVLKEEPKEKGEAA